MDPSDAPASRSPAKTPEPPSGPPALRPSHPSEENHSRRRGEEEDVLASDSAVGQFSYAPATQTTVVTTTTTTTTNFSPFVMRAPRCLHSLDPRDYPLASAPTPESLKDIRFDVGDQPIIFREPDDAKGAAAEHKHQQDQQDDPKAPRGVVKSVSAEVSRESANPTPHGLNGSEITGNKHSSPSREDRRSVSPLSLREPRLVLKRARSPTAKRRRPRANASGARLCTQPNLGLATPETESGSFVVNNEYNDVRRGCSSSFTGPSSGKPVEASFDEQDCSEPGSSANPSDRGADKDRFSSSVMEKSPLFERRHASSSARLAPSADGMQAQWPSRYEEAAQTRSGPKRPVVDPSARPRHGPSLLGTHSTPVDSTTSQNVSLPSPSLSPITAMNAQNLDRSFETIEDHANDTESSIEHRPRRRRRRITNPDELQQPSRDKDSLSLMDMPLMLDYFEAIPDKMKPYMMYHLLRRCPKPTLHFVADVVNPTLKCDFLARLPAELGLNVVKFLDVKTMCRASQVSKKWRQIINSDEMTWQAHFLADNFALPDGELERAIKEGWGWQYPKGGEDCEVDLSSCATTTFTDPDYTSIHSSPSGHTLSGGDAQQSTSPLSSSRRPKRKAVSKLLSRKAPKRKGEMKSLSRDCPAEISECLADVILSDSPYQAANAAAQAVPYPNVGLPSLRSLHLYKSLYQRHYLIHRNWMRQDVQPMHFAFQAHDRHVVTCLQFDADKILTGSDDTNINVYSTANGALRASLVGHEGGVWALQYHENTLVSGSTDRSVRVWDIESAKCTQVFHGHTSTVRCLQILLPTEVGRLRDGRPKMMPPEPLIITGSRDSSLRIWKLPRPGDPEYFQAGPPQDESTCPYFVRVLNGHAHSVRAIAARGDTLISGSYDCTVKVWKISTGEAIHRLEGHNYKVYSVVLDHKRNRCISGSMDHLVKIWSLETGALLYNLEGHSSLVGLLDLDSDRLVSAAADSTLRIWEPENGQCKATLTAHTGAITCFQHDSQKIISGSDRTLKMWNVRTGECLRDLLTDLSGVWQVKFSDRRCVAAVQRDRFTYIEVLDFGASRDGVPAHRLGKRIVVGSDGHETEVDHSLPDADTSDI